MVYMSGTYEGEKVVHMNTVAYYFYPPKTLNDWIKGYRRVQELLLLNTTRLPWAFLAPDRINSVPFLFSRER